MRSVPTRNVGGVLDERFPLLAATATGALLAPLSSSSQWLAYVPGHIATRILERPDQSPIGQEQRFEAAVLFVDMAGFTPMSEALGRVGRAGTEELTAILNGSLGQVVEVIEAYGGIVGKFCGDAVIALFPAEAEPTAASVAIQAARALACAIEIREAARDWGDITTSAGTFDLGLKVGVAVGQVLSVTVGDPALQLECVLAGGAIDLAAAAEGRASSGEVTAHRGVLELCPDVEVAEKRGEFVCLARLRRQVPTAPLPPLAEVSPEAVPTLARYLHPSIAERIASGHAGFVNEHRKVTVAFVGFGDFDYERDPQVSARLQSYLSAVMATVESHGGYLRQVEMGDKGSKYIVVFGAPLAHEDDETRALRCALELSKLGGGASRIGVSTGLAYCGQLGSASRREYALVGDTVNLAARLMQVAEPGQVLVAGTPSARATHTVAAQVLDPVVVKGKDAPVPVYAVKAFGSPAQSRAALRQEPHHLFPFVGRHAELRRVNEQLDRLLAGEGQVVHITGEAGIGKSRFVGEITEAAEREFAVHVGYCQPQATTVGYGVWHDVWRSFFDLDPTASAEAQVAELRVQLGNLDPNFVPRLPLLRNVVNLPIADNMLTSGLDGEVRLDLLRSLLLDVIRRRAASTPTVLVLEDCHWIDALSAELVDFMARNLAEVAVMLVVVERPRQLDGEGSELWATSVAHLTQIHLEPLNDHEARAFLLPRLERIFGPSVPVPSEVLDSLSQRAEGNPFYLEEILNFLRDRGIDPLDAGAINDVELPDTLYSLVLARIDQLPEAEQATVKLASVLGRRFPAAWVAASYPQIGSPEDIPVWLDALRRRDLVDLMEFEPQPTYLFRHAAIQEVAYNSLSFSLRETLHHAVARFIETDQPNTDQHLEVLAYHYGRTRNHDKQRYYYRRAGDAAKAAYANQAAVAHYQRLLPLLTSASSSGVGSGERPGWERERIAVLCHLGEVLQLAGAWQKAEAAYREALASAEAADAHDAVAHCRCLLGHLLSHAGWHEEGLRRLEEARAWFESVGDFAWLSRALEYLSFTSFQQSDYDRALEYAEQHRRLAADHGDQRGVSMAYENIGCVHWHQSDARLALTCFEQELQVATEVGHTTGIIHANSNLAGLFADQGDYARAIEHLSDAWQAAVDIGYEHAAGVIVGNAGELCRQQGDYERALACYEQSLRRAAELGDSKSALTAVGNIAIVSAALGAEAEADLLYSRAVSLARVLNHSYSLCEYLHHWAVLLANQQRWTEAQAVNDEALELANQIDRRDIAFFAQLLAVRLRRTLRHSTLFQARRELGDLYEQCPDDRERAALAYELWRLRDERAGPEPQANPDQERWRVEAAERYLALHARAQNSEYRQRYEELTGQALSAPPPLPQLAGTDGTLSSGVSRLPRVVDNLLDRIPLARQLELAQVA